MRVYRFINEQYGLEALRDKRLKISGIMNLNDPFEFLSVNLSDKSVREAIEGLKLKLSKKYGLLCFSKSWQDPVQWAHYADKHKGLCLGFDISGKNFMKVRYVKERLDSPKSSEDLNLDFTKKLLATKFVRWKYEQEYRFFVTLKDKEKGSYFCYFFKEELDLKKIIVGIKSNISRKDISKALGNNGFNIETFKARAAFNSFKIVKQQNENRWT